MDIFELYISTKESININESYLNSLNKKINLLKYNKQQDDVKGVSYETERVQASGNDIPVSQLYTELNRLIKERDIYQQMIDTDRKLLLDMKDIIDTHLKGKKKDTVYKVFILHYLRGKSFSDVADILYISLDHVYRCNGIIKKKLEKARKEFEKVKELI